MITLSAEEDGLFAAGDLTRESAPAFRELLLAACDGQAEVALDVSRVAAIDSAGVQLLASFLSSVDGARLLNPSPELRESCARLGAEARLFGAS